MLNVHAIYDMICCRIFDLPYLPVDTPMSISKMTVIMKVERVTKKKTVNNEARVMKKQSYA